MCVFGPFIIIVGLSVGCVGIPMGLFSLVGCDKLQGFLWDCLWAMWESQWDCFLRWAVEFFLVG